MFEVRRGEKKNAPSFARAFIPYGEIYVNMPSLYHIDPMHQSLGITKYLKGYAGFQLEKEVESLEKAFKPEHPFVFILGGAKI